VGDENLQNPYSAQREILKSCGSYTDNYDRTARCVYNHIDRLIRNMEYRKRKYGGKTYLEYILKKGLDEGLGRPGLPVEGRPLPRLVPYRAGGHHGASLPDEAGSPTRKGGVVHRGREKRCLSATTE